MPKGKEIPSGSESLRTAGLHSKIYLAAYKEKITVSEISKKIYGDPNKNQKISTTFSDERFSSLFDLEKPMKEDRRKTYVTSRVEPFLKELEKNMDLTKSERKKLKDYLDGPFRKATQKKYLDIDFGKGVNAYSELLGLLTAVTSIERAVRTSVSFLKKSDKNISQKKAKKKFYDVWQNKAPKEFNMGPVPWGDEEIFEPVKDFSDKLLEKLDEADLGGSREVLKKHGKFYEKVMNKILSEIRN